MYRSDCILASQCERGSISTTRSHGSRFDAIPPISSDLERIFSLTGLLSANRARLQSDIIGASMAVGSWDKESVIDMVDGQLKRPQKEGK
jgi:hypothetical protein